MSEEEKLNKNIIIVMFTSGMVLLLAVLIACAIDSPKFMEPEISYVSETEYEEMYYSEASEAEQESDSVFPICINTATSEELQLIPDIGPATAKLIIDYRNEYGTIVTFSELLSIDGIGNKTVEKLKEYCVIN